MKNLKTLTIGLLITVLFSACGINAALVQNQNQNSTQVHLARANYKVINKVSGSAEVDYIFFIGGNKKKQLYDNAYSNMAKGANLEGGSRALINITTEDYVGGFAPFYVNRTITVSAYVIEFSGE